MVASRMPPEPNTTRRPPATTPEALENQMISMAYDTAKKQMLDGSASAQVVVHFLKLGSSRERLEQKKMEQETILLVAKAEMIASQERTEELYKAALGAMSRYQGREDSDED